MKKPLSATFVLVCASGLAMAQSPAGPPSNQLTPQVLGELLRSATTFHELLRNLNLNGKLGPDVHAIGPDGVSHHSIQRTAATVGAGAGIGVALGSLSHNPNRALIGALIGSAGGLIVDEILKHREQSHPKLVYEGPPPELKQR
jgi:hypothetical protein